MKKLNKEHINQLITTALLALALAYVSTFRSETNQLTIFADSLSIISLCLIAVGALYSTMLHGDTDGLSYYMSQGGLFKKKGQKEISFEEYTAQKDEIRADKINAPLYVGLLGLAVSLIITYGFVVK